MPLGVEWRVDIPYNSPANADIAMELAPGRYRYIVERPVLDPPGARWTYCGGPTALLGELIADGTGMCRCRRTGQAVLFAPLGIGSFGRTTGADGAASAASGLRLAPRDLATMGELVLAGGARDCHPIVPAGWIHAMLQPRLQTSWGA